MKHKIFFFVSAILVLTPLSLTAQLPINVLAIISAYRQYKEVGPVIKVPTVVEVSFNGEFFERPNFAVLDTTTNTFEPSLFVDRVQTDEIPVKPGVFSAVGPGDFTVTPMFDKNLRTYSHFDLPERGLGAVELALAYEKSVVASTLTLLLENNVALPKTVEVKVETESGQRIVYAESAMNSTTVRFPKTIAKEWYIVFTYSQPLRISELKLIQENAGLKNDRGVRFLAQPNHEYRVYFDPDRLVNPPVGEAPNLFESKGVAKLGGSVALANAAYVIADFDKDGVEDLRDNCVVLANTDQVDVDENGRGDVCDDFDKDGLENSFDNCPNLPNRDQKDADGDGIGDVCDDEESRITEKYQWLPWLGIGLAAVMLVILFIIAFRHGAASLKDGMPPDMPVA